MFVNGKFGNAMMNVRPLAVHAFVDFEYIYEEETEEREGGGWMTHGKSSRRTLTMRTPSMNL